jgi:hypothetical protein
MTIPYDVLGYILLWEEAALLPGGLGSFGNPAEAV